MDDGKKHIVDAGPGFDRKQIGAAILVLDLIAAVVMGLFGDRLGLESWILYVIVGMLIIGGLTTFIVWNIIFADRDENV